MSNLRSIQLIFWLPFFFSDYSLRYTLNKILYKKGAFVIATPFIKFIRRENNTHAPGKNKFITEAKFRSDFEHSGGVYRMFFFLNHAILNIVVQTEGKIKI